VQERIAWIIAVLLVGGAAFFGGRQLGVQAGQEARQQSAQQFFAQRGGNGPGGPGGRGGAVTGTVESVSGNSVVIATQDGTKVTVTLAQGGQVRKQVDGTLADVKQGDRVVAFGARSGDTLEAQAIQLGGLPGGFGRQGGQGQGGQGQGGQGDVILPAPPPGP
jgi:hypothetical protein